MLTEKTCLLQRPLSNSYQISHERNVNEKQFFLFTNKCNDSTFADIHSISNKPPLGFKIK